MIKMHNIYPCHLHFVLENLRTLLDDEVDVSQSHVLDLTNRTF